MTRPLGRWGILDPANRGFPSPYGAKPTVKRILWPHRAPVLDQLDLGSCTGNALAQWANTDYARPFRLGFLARAAEHREFLNEDDAIKLYSLATQFDGMPGGYPPEDTGATGNAVAKAGRKLGLLESYRWAFSVAALLAALQKQPIIIGSSWFAGMDDPSAHGFIEPTGELRGGHEWLLLGFDLEFGEITGLQSWGGQWPTPILNGRFKMKLAHFRALMGSQFRGDATIPIGKG